MEKEVYIVGTGYDYEDHSVDGVFTTKEKAKEFLLKKHPNMIEDNNNDENNINFTNGSDENYSVDYGYISKYILNVPKK